MKTPRPESAIRRKPLGSSPPRTGVWSWRRATVRIAAGVGRTVQAPYWYLCTPTSARRGIASAEAQDLTQAFFAELLEKERLRAATLRPRPIPLVPVGVLEPLSGQSMARRSAAKRGGDRTPLSIDYASAESRYQWEPADDRQPSELSSGGGP
ncbi:MAG: hypothetical protein R3C99_07235 [Pirellulaceae bacterium]